MQSPSEGIFTPYSREVFLGKMEVKCRSRWRRNVWHDGDVYMGKGLLILLRENALLKRIHGVKIYCIESTEKVQIVFKRFRCKMNNGKKRKRLYKITEYIMRHNKKIKVRAPYEEKIASELYADEMLDFRLKMGKKRFEVQDDQEEPLQESKL